MDSEKEKALAAYAYFLILRKRKKEKKKRLWKKKYNCNHDIFGCYGTLFKELKEHDEHSFANFSRMYPHIFDELLIKITPLRCTIIQIMNGYECNNTVICMR